MKLTFSLNIVFIKVKKMPVRSIKQMTILHPLQVPRNKLYE